MREYRVNEIFRSIQGEGYWSGRSAVFIRFSGCNLRCGWCDTDHSEGVDKKLSHLVSEAHQQARSNDLLVLTGGEPMMQVDEQLLNSLFEYFNFIAIETNGTLAIPTGAPFGPSAGKRLWIAMSPKDPLKDFSIHGPNIARADEIKIVVPGNGWTHDDLLILGKMAETSRLYVQPQDDAKDARQWAIDFVMRNPKWRISLQLQKILGFH